MDVEPLNPELPDRIIKYHELTEEALKKLIGDIMCTMPPPKRQLKVLAITPDGLVPIEQTPEFDRAMKEEYKKRYG